MYKVIFDRSILHESQLSNLKQSALQDCVNKNKISIYFTTAFWEETLRIAGNNKVRLQEELSFLFLINPRNWFSHPEVIVDYEFKNKYRKPQYYLFSQDFIAQKQSDFLDIAYSRIVIDAALQEYLQVNKNKRQREKVFLEDAKEIKGRYSNFNDFYNNENHRFLEPLKMRHGVNSIDLNECMFASIYSKFFMACWYLPTVKRELGKDWNNRMDAEQLSFLTWADIMVSNDGQFMKSAFELIYGNSSKKLFKVDQFLDFIDSL